VLKKHVEALNPSVSVPVDYTSRECTVCTSDAHEGPASIVKVLQCGHLFNNWCIADVCQMLCAPNAARRPADVNLSWMTTEHGLCVFLSGLGSRALIDG